MIVGSKIFRMLVRGNEYSDDALRNPWNSKKTCESQVKGLQ